MAEGGNRRKSYGSGPGERGDDPPAKKRTLGISISETGIRVWSLVTPSRWCSGVVSTATCFILDLPNLSPYPVVFGGVFLVELVARKDFDQWDLKIAVACRG